jgi:vancomycin resistance protein VanJ
MSTYTIRCRCGEIFHVSAAHASARVKCRKCGRVLGARLPRRRRSWRGKLRSIGEAALSRIAMAASRLGRGSRRTAEDGGGRLGTTVRVASWAYLGFVVALTLVIWCFGDRWWPATILLFSGRWVAAVPLCLLLPAALVLRPRSVAPLVLAAIIVLGPLMGWRIGWRRWLSPSAGTTFRVVSFNAEGGAQIASDLLAHVHLWGADLVAFQECGEQLAAAVRAVPGWSHDEVNGLCLLSRFPIRARNVMNREALMAVRRDVAGIGGSGDVVRYDVQFPDRLVHVTNVHLETPRKGLEGLLHRSTFDVTRLILNTQLRDLESDLARRHVDAGGGPAIVLGDFNTPAESRIFQDHWGDLTDAFSTVGVGFGMTKYNGWIRVRIDHVLTDRSLRPTRAVVGPDAGSDHLPLIVDLAVQQSP